MKEIQLTQGYLAFVDDGDWERCMQYKWCARVDRRKTRMDGSHYVVATMTRVIDQKQTTILMHRYIMGLGAGDSKVVDHLDQNPLNNQKANLEVKTNRENTRRQKLSRRNKSGYKGVSKHKNKWRAQIEFQDKACHLGMFKNVHDAARAYNAAAERYFGKDALLNVIQENQT